MPKYSIRIQIDRDVRESSTETEVKWECCRLPNELVRSDRIAFMPDEEPAMVQGAVAARNHARLRNETLSESDIEVTTDTRTQNYKGKKSVGPTYRNSNTRLLPKAIFDHVFGADQKEPAK